jgi:hypothetical protein
VTVEVVNGVVKKWGQIFILYFGEGGIKLGTLENWNNGGTKNILDWKLESESDKIIKEEG